MARVLEILCKLLQLGDTDTQNTPLAKTQQRNRGISMMSLRREIN